MRNLLIVALLVGCSSTPMDGDRCTGTLFCEGPASGLFCEGVFHRYPCPGPNGCLEDDARKLATCDIQNSAPGDRCPDFFFGKGFCETGAGAVIICESDFDGGIEIVPTTHPKTWTRHACGSGMTCTTAGDQVACR